jgi:hypothetical protein
MRRRRVYILSLEDILREPPPPPRLRPFLRFLALIASITGFGVTAVQLVLTIIPENSHEHAFMASIGYGLIMLLFFALSKRINHV